MIRHRCPVASRRAAWRPGMAWRSCVLEVHPFVPSGYSNRRGRARGTPPFRSARGTGGRVCRSVRRAWCSTGVPHRGTHRSV